MCNNYVFRPPDARLFSHLKLGGDIAYPFGKPNLGPGEVRIGDRAPIVLRYEGEPALIVAPWAWKSPQGRPVFNFRSEGRSFAGSERCLIPADGFFEFTDAQPGETRKTKWLFSLSGHANFWIAGIVKHGAFAMLTTDPGPDVKPYHDRQVVVLEPERGLDWLDLRRPEAELLRPLEAESLTVERVWPPA